MYLDFLKKNFSDNGDLPFIVWRDQEYSYGWLLEAQNAFEQKFGDLAGQVVSIKADYEPKAIAALLSLIQLGCVVVPYNKNISDARREEYDQLSCVDTSLEIIGDDCQARAIAPSADKHELLKNIQSDQRPGLILFSSGTSGKSKGIVHDLVPLLDKFKEPRKRIRSIPFLLFDHIGGFNTLLYNLANTGCLVIVEDRSPFEVCKAVEKHRVELLPLSPTFINLILLSGLYTEYDLSSLKVISYGAEAMAPDTLKRLYEIFPEVKLTQTYGLSEIGIVASKSKSSDSLWLKLGGSGVETRIVDGLLEIKSPSPMLGYINAPSPFTEDGWLMTGDMVEVDGDYIKILGRESDQINVGGEKVFPTEIENIILTMDNVEDVSITSEESPITGKKIIANIKLIEPEEKKSVFKRMRLHCKDSLEAFKIPSQVKIIEHTVLYTDRYKKKRAALSE